MLMIHEAHEAHEGKTAKATKNAQVRPINYYLQII